MAAAGSPCAKATPPFFRLRILRPKPALARKALASKTASSCAGCGPGGERPESAARSPGAGFADRGEAARESRLAETLGLGVGRPLALMPQLRRAVSTPSIIHPEMLPGCRPWSILHNLP